MICLLFPGNINFGANVILLDEWDFLYSVVLCTLPCLAEPFQCNNFPLLMMFLDDSYLFVSEINESLIKAHKHSLLFSA